MGSAIERFAIEGSGTTVVHPLGLLVLLLSGATLVLAPRRFALWGFIVLVCFISSRQAVAIGGFNFYFARIMILIFGMGRLVLQNDFATVKWNRLDATMALFGICYFSAGAINWEFSPSEMKMRSGYITELVGTYFLFRLLMQDECDVRATILGLAVASVPLAFFFMIEHLTARNLFSVFGGVPEMTAVRDGRLRCQGAFVHPILAGVFWATMMPLFIAGVVGRWNGKYIFLCAVFCSGLIVFFTASSTPVLGVAAAIAGWVLFPLRRYARLGFALFALTCLFLHLVMQGPVWSLIQKINITSGSQGYHRYILVDGFITHFHEWWLLGSKVGTGHWGHYTFDTANQFVSVGVSAGFGVFALFVGMTVMAMNASGRVQQFSPHLGWGLGVSIAVISLCFFGISIWGQLHFGWTFPIAIAGGIGFHSTAGQVEISGSKNFRFGAVTYLSRK